MPVRLDRAKEEARRFLPDGQPGRETLLALPDEMPEATFDALVPTLIRLLRLRATP